MVHLPHVCDKLDKLLTLCCAQALQACPSGGAPLSHEAAKRLFNPSNTSLVHPAAACLAADDPCEHIAGQAAGLSDLSSQPWPCSFTKAGLVQNGCSCWHGRSADQAPSQGAPRIRCSATAVACTPAGTVAATRAGPRHSRAVGSTASQQMSGSQPDLSASGCLQACHAARQHGEVERATLPRPART